ncbi:DUF4167 domain-containing protein [Rhizobium sp. SL86]|uniref:DUF4167 domain-containing protein n=1 Tax=Rhizobium sp. SL86 TaxID=2995148 RepID=UPI0022731591|nr:DUF4167 domain-containing protein [Rhizobium sp. SL86]MCY1666887.1 DUF4167 domain-containing protein [Rhizobium sp. SL86]
MNRKPSRRALQGGQTNKQRLLEKYRQHLQFAEYKLSAGDRVGAENDLQHAEHFLRSAAEQKEAD